MLAGHIGAAAGAKHWAPRVPIWALLAASFLLDILFLGFWAIGKERMYTLPDTSGSYGNMGFEIGWSHSFIGTVLICLVVLIVASRWWGAKGAFVLSCLVFSHWFLDMMVHRGDLPILPGYKGTAAPVGLGLWDAPLAAAILELIIILGGSMIWLKSPEAGPQRARSAAITALAGTAILIAHFML